MGEGWSHNTFFSLYISRISIVCIGDVTTYILYSNETAFNEKISRR